MKKQKCIIVDHLTNIVITVKGYSVEEEEEDGTADKIHSARET